MSDFITPAQIAGKVRDLPPMPAVVMELIASLGKDDLQAEELSRKLSRDQALSAKTLRLANSSFYGLARRVDSVQEAIAILGLRTVRTVVMAAGVTGSFGKPRHEGFGFDAFWRHSIGTALCAQALAAELRMDSEVGFTIGLLHDVGRLALVSGFPDQYARTIQYQRQHDCPWTAAEQETLGIDHAAAGGCIAEHWRFSPVIVQAIAGHHSPAPQPGPDLMGLAHLADCMSHALGLAHQDDEYVPPLDPGTWAALAPKAESCYAVFAQAESQLEGVCRALGTEVPQ